MKLKRVSNKRFGVFHTFDGLSTVEEAIFAAKYPARVSKHADMSFAKAHLEKLANQSRARMRVNLVRTCDPSTDVRPSSINILQGKQYFYPMIGGSDSETSSDKQSSPGSIQNSPAYNLRSNTDPVRSAEKKRRKSEETPEGLSKIPKSPPAMTPRSPPAMTPPKTAHTPKRPQARASSSRQGSSRKGKGFDKYMTRVASATSLYQASDNSWAKHTAVNALLRTLDLLGDPFRLDDMFPRDDDTMIGGAFTRFTADVIAQYFDNEDHYPHFRIMSDIRHDFKTHLVPKSFRDRNAYALTEDVFVAMVVATNPSIYDHLYVMNADATDAQGNSLFDRKHLKLHNSIDGSAKHGVVDMPLGRSIHMPDMTDKCHLMTTKRTILDSTVRDKTLQTLYTVGNFLDPHSVKGHVQTSMRDTTLVNDIIFDFFDTIFNKPITTSVLSLHRAFPVNAPSIVNFFPVDGDECDYSFDLQWPNDAGQIELNRDSFQINSLKSNKSNFFKYMNKVFQPIQSIALNDLKKFYAMCFKGLGDHIQLHELVRYKRLCNDDASKGKGKMPRVEVNSWKHSLSSDNLVFVTKDRILIADAMKQQDVPVLFTCKSIKDKYDNYTNIQPLDNNAITNLHTFKKLLFFFSKTRYAGQNDVVAVKLVDKITWYSNIVNDFYNVPPVIKIFKPLKLKNLLNSLNVIITELNKVEQPTKTVEDALFDVFGQFTESPPLFPNTRNNPLKSAFQLSQRRSSRFLELETSAPQNPPDKQRTALIATLDILFEMLHQVYGCLQKRYKDIFNESRAINDMTDSLQRFVEVEEMLLNILTYSQNVKENVDSMITKGTDRTMRSRQHAIVKDMIEELFDEYLELNTIFSTASSLKVFNEDSSIDFEHVMLAAHKHMRMLLLAGRNYDQPLDTNLVEMYNRIDIGVFFDKRNYVSLFEQHPGKQDEAVMQILTTKTHCEMRLKQIQRGEMFKIYHQAFDKFANSEERRHNHVRAAFEKLDYTYSRRIYDGDETDDQN